MAIKRFELIGMPINDFDEILKSNQKLENKDSVIRGTEARLIPPRNKLDELSLTSVFLSSLTMVEEFKNLFCKEIGISRVGSLKAYTEISFPEIKVFNEDNEKKGPLRVDGLLLQVVGGKIKDATLFEMKMGLQEVQKDQIFAYQNLARDLKIPRLVSISNQFVPSPTDYPIDVSRIKSVDLYHFSWRYIIALGSILLTDNELNINDPTQVKIMKEVMVFLRHRHAAVKTFDSMSRGWSNVVEGVRARKEFSRSHPDLAVAVQDWVQEEQDLALKMSEDLGLMVDCTKKRYKTMQDRWEFEKKEIVEKGVLESNFRIKNIVSPLLVQVDLGARRVICTVEVKVPQDIKTAAGRLNWLKRQIEKCKLKNGKGFRAIEPSLWLNAMVKGRMANPKELYLSYEKLVDESRNCDIKSVKVSYEKDLAGRFTQSQKFIEKYEETVLSFYSIIVQNLKNWEEAPPKMSVKQADIGSESVPSRVIDIGQ